MSWLSPSSAMPIRRTRVVCALALTMATFWPTSALTRVDLPALGAPTMAIRPQRSGHGFNSVRRARAAAVSASCLDMPSALAEARPALSTDTVKRGA